MAIFADEGTMTTQNMVLIAYCCEMSLGACMCKSCYVAPVLRIQRPTSGRRVDDVHVSVIATGKTQTATDISTHSKP